MPETVVHFQVRMPPPLHERLSSQAKEDKSSLNALVVSLLTRALDHPEKKNTTPSGQAGS
jgi:predicted HicB family RNase H-like nuclease